MTTGLISAPYIIPLRVEQAPKLLIDTNTLIEIRCDTSDVDIYYTLDGSKPDGFVTLASRRSTIQYKKPFYVPRELATAGKVVIKAIAVSHNGVRESIVVTKTFDIKLVPSDHAQSDEYENRYLLELQQERQELMRRIQLENEQTQRRLAESKHHSPLQDNPYLHSSNPPNQFERLNGPLRCTHCFAPKLNSSYSRFCTECGLPWQKLTHTPPEHHSTKVCSHCQSTIPFNSNACVVCEKAVGSELQRRSSIPNKTKILCPKCKSSNPTHLRQCYMCESNLMPTPTPSIRASVSVPTGTKPSDTMMMTCSKCFRLNNSDARFCDWCGAHPERIPVPIACTKCRSNNDANARFCSNCGCAIEPPLKMIDTRIRNDSYAPASSVIASTLTNHSANPTWLNANATLSYHREPSSIRKTEAATQTSGIYYPSAKDLDILMTQNRQLIEEQEFKERRPVLTSVSPGKGYWKQQLDHVCAHLKSYATNHPDFRLLIGEPRMGKMVHATVHDTEHQVVIQAVFRKPENLAQTPVSSSFYANDRHDHYHYHSERSSTYSSTFNSDEEYTIERPRRTKGKKRSKKRPASATISTKTLTPNHALVKILQISSSENKRKKPSERLHIYEEVKQLIHERNASGHCQDQDGNTALQLAVRNGHFECLSLLIKDGKAKINAQGSRGNTALHEACLLGVNGIEPLEILLKHGGDINVLNDKKQSISDLASKQTNHHELLQVIAKYKGERMLKQQEKLSSSQDLSRSKFVKDYH